MTDYGMKTPIPTLPAFEVRPITEFATLRDQFAMAALTGILSFNPCMTANQKQCAEVSYEFADMMLEARKEKK